MDRGVPDLEDLSREELIALVLAQMDRINELAATVARLEHLLSRNSGNSSMPVCHEREGGERM